MFGDGICNLYFTLLIQKSLKLKCPVETRIMLEEYVYSDETINQTYSETLCHATTKFQTQYQSRVSHTCPQLLHPFSFLSTTFILFHSLFPPLGFFLLQLRFFKTRILSLFNKNDKKLFLLSFFIHYFIIMFLILLTQVALVFYFCIKSRKLCEHVKSKQSPRLIVELFQ